MSRIKPQVYFARKKINLSLLPPQPAVCDDSGMNEIGKAIKAALADRKLTQRWLAERIGVSDNAVSKWIRSGKVSKEHIPDVCVLLGIPVGVMLDAEDVLPSPNITDGAARLQSSVSPGPDLYRGRVPLISWAQAGMWTESTDIYEPGYAKEWPPVFQDGAARAYALRVEGDSMTATHGKSYPEGTIIVVDPDLRSPVSGQRVIAKLSGSDLVTFKQYVEEDGRRWLRPLNPMHPPIHDPFVVLGTVVSKYEPDWP